MSRLHSALKSFGRIAGTKTPRKRRKPSSRLSAPVEGLEDRQLLSANPLLASDGSLFIDGTPQNDSAYVLELGGRVGVGVKDGDTSMAEFAANIQKFDRNDISRIVLRGFDENDKLVNLSNIPVERTAAPQEMQATTNGVITLDAQTGLKHQIGRRDSDGWSANTAQDRAGFLSFGPYTTAVSAGTHTASFQLLVDNTTADNAAVVKLDVFDATSGRVLAEQVVRRGDFHQPFTYQSVDLKFSSEAGHKLEFRTQWMGTSYVKLHSVRVSTESQSQQAPEQSAPTVEDQYKELQKRLDDFWSGTSNNQPNPGAQSPLESLLHTGLQLEAEGGQLKHQIGRRDSDGWSANTAQDRAGFLSFGPYTTAVSGGTHTASFRLMVDNTTADNSPVVKVDVFDATSGQVLAERVVRRGEFNRAFSYQDIDLKFTNQAGHKLEFRTQWLGTSYVKLDAVRIDGDAAPAQTPVQQTPQQTSKSSNDVDIIGEAVLGQQDPQPKSTIEERANDLQKRLDDFWSSIIGTPSQSGPESPLLSLLNNGQVFQAEGSQLKHQIGRRDTDGWSANTAQDRAGFLSFGPYTTAVPAGNNTASFRLMVDNTTADNSPVVKVDVFDATSGRVLAERVVRRGEFNRPFSYQDIDLKFTNQAGHKLEFRTQWMGTSYVKLDAVRVGSANANLPLTGLDLPTQNPGSPIGSGSLAGILDLPPDQRRAFEEALTARRDFLNNPAFTGYTPEQLQKYLGLSGMFDSNNPSTGTSGNGLYDLIPGLVNGLNQRDNNLVNGLFGSSQPSTGGANGLDFATWLFNYYNQRDMGLAGLIP